MTELVSFRDVSYSYGANLVVDQVSFSLARGTITTLIGPNGGGKTTIAKLLLSIVEPSLGSVVVNASSVSYAPQSIMVNKNLPLSVSDFIKILAPDYANSKVAAEVLQFLNFENISSMQLHQLSGGQRQRVVLASAILQSADLLVLDEPTQGLDVSGQQIFYLLLEKIRKEVGSTIFIISHDLFTVMKNSDQVLCLNHHICCKGRPTHTVVKGVDGVSFYSHHHDHIHH